MRKILFIQPGYAHYRDDLFEILSQRHNIHFLFEKSKNTYPGNDKPKKIGFTFIDQKFRNNVMGLIYYLHKFKYDIVISSVSASTRSIIAYIYAIFLHKKFILWILEWRKPEYKKNNFKRYIKMFRYWIGKHILIKSHALVVGGTAAYDYALSIGKKKEEIFIALQCSKDLRKNIEISPAQRRTDNTFTFLYLGRIISWKGLDILIEAFHLLRQKRDDVSLLIAGDGPSRDYCFNLSKSLKITDIEFIGSVDPYKTVEIYQKADVFVLPSYELDSYYEVWGLTVNEAMSMYLPVITTTRVGASYDMVINCYNGFIVQENSVDELYKAMRKILKCDLTQMGVNSRKIFEEKNSCVNMANGFSDARKYVMKQ